MRKNLSKKTLSAFLAIVMTLATMAGMFTFSAGAETGETVTDWTANEIHLKTAEDLTAFIAKISVASASVFTNQTIILDNDIDLNPGWTASTFKTNGSAAPTNILSNVGSSSKGYFAGTIDGQGYSISGIYTQLQTNCGIFGQVKNAEATIKNLIIKNSTFYDKGAQHNSALIGKVNNGTATFDNVKVCDDVYLCDNRDYAGFFVGQNVGTVNISNSIFEGNLETYHGGGSSYCVYSIGAFVGEQDANSTATITNCIFAGDISFRNISSASSYIIGYRANVADTAILTNCYYIADPDVKYATVTFEKNANDKYEAEPTGTAYSDLTGVSAITKNQITGIAAQTLLNSMTSNTYNMNAWVATTTGTPELRADVTASATDNGKKISDGETDDFGWHGFQKKTGENSDSLRLLGTVKEDALSKYDSIGFKAVAYFVDHAGNKVQTNSVTYTTVYESVAADGTPIEEDGSYFFAQTVKGIPQNAGDVIFEITTYAMQGSTEIIGDTYRIVYDCL